MEVETFVQLAGGEYFFLPSMPALELSGNSYEHDVRERRMPAARDPAGSRAADGVRLMETLLAAPAFRRLADSATSADGSS